MADDFDWVTARHACSLASAFAHLRLVAERDLATRQALGGLDPDVRFELRAVPDAFTVVRRLERPHGTGRGVTVRCTGDTIVVTTDAERTLLTATLTLNDAGECRFKVDDLELEAWQVLRRAFEALFFGDGLR